MTRERERDRAESKHKVEEQTADVNEEQKQQKGGREKGREREAGATWASFYMISLLFHFSLFALSTTALSANVCAGVYGVCVCGRVCASGIINLS